MNSERNLNEDAGGGSALNELLGSLPEALLWMTGESERRIANGGNSKGTVPVHSRPSSTAKVPLYTEEQMQAERERCFEIGRNVELPNAELTGRGPQDLNNEQRL